MPEQRLASGRHDLSREEVVASQRERLLRAMLESVAERGFSETRVGDVTSRAGVSRATFYELFDDLEDCFVTLHDVLIRLAVKAVEAASDRSAPWPDQVRAGLESLLRFIAARPGAARVAVVEPIAAGDRAELRYRTAIRKFVPLLEPGRDHSPWGADLPPRVATTVVGGVADLITAEIEAGRAADLLDLLPELVYVVLVPYLGHDAALAEMERTPGHGSPRTITASTTNPPT